MTLEGLIWNVRGIANC